ncbi:hypothetical protein F5Y19DRAFT_479027 [Xylariaceae sp. FL1651]|nr:hypothetical protein F5Y19DRAFT_479027 [Xylariaceae sp. FL1651]
MSTFNGFISEFPNIKVDFFRRLPGFPPVLACFLSHVHSDHLAGLETFNGSFIYCSAATSEILLRLEKSAVRLNYAKGILEDPRLQTYRHLEKKLKPIPLDTPVTIELHPGHTIQVTLLDANHCVGAVMFLFEGNGKAVLYTGDIRCEPRFVTATAQNPNMVQYSSGWKALDRIYLDTSIVDNYPLQTKAEGLHELSYKLQKYPNDTIFHFQAWTYGYEDVWITLSKILNSKIHVDKYKMRVFESLVTRPKDSRWAVQTHLAKEAPALVGFTCGNNHHEGCLTLDENVRIHSCEKGVGCNAMETKPVVWIRPIVTHLKDGRDVLEVGIGGGGEDLAQATTLTLEDILEILQLMSARETLSADIHQYIEIIKKSLDSGRDMSVIADAGYPMDEAAHIPMLMKSLFHKLDAMRNPIRQKEELSSSAPLPNVIYFPYARHSSLPELRQFVGAFKPKDITPCTFDADSWLRNEWSINDLFGDCCSGDKFAYDTLLEQRSEELAKRHQGEDSHPKDTQETASSPSGLTPVVASPDNVPILGHGETIAVSSSLIQESVQHEVNLVPQSQQVDILQKRDYNHVEDDACSDNELDLQDDSQAPSISDRTYAARRRAFNIARSNLTGDSWETIGLISTTDNHTSIEEELGEP